MTTAAEPKKVVKTLEITKEEYAELQEARKKKKDRTNKNEIKRAVRKSVMETTGLGKAIKDAQKAALKKAGFDVRE